MARARARRPLPPLNESKLNELALRYVGKYATTRAKLRAYLSRKLRERGWSEGREPDLEALAERFARAGYVDDAVYALSKSQSLSARGYGKRRVVEKLRFAGVDEEDGRAAFDHAEEQALDAALRFAERKRLGPFARDAADRNLREKAIAAMVRAGHAPRLARAVVSLPPGTGNMEDIRISLTQIKG
jgi:regulatory protein